MTPSPRRPTVAHLDLAAIEHNTALLAAGRPLIAVVKADAYGHGAEHVLPAITAGGATGLAVATLDEALTLRSVGTKLPILLLTEPAGDEIDDLLHHHITPTLHTDAGIYRYATAPGPAPRPAHLKIDVGMARLGIRPHKLAPLLARLDTHPHIHLTGCYTHFPCADDPDPARTFAQHATFTTAATRIRARHPHATTHVANTAATLTRRLTADAVRPGIGLYGLSPAPHLPAAAHHLRPALTLTTIVEHLRPVTAGEPALYGHRWHAPCDGHLAILPLGYGDGIPRTLGPLTVTAADGHRYQTLPTATMDRTLLWCPDQPPTLGTTITLLGPDTTADQWADATGRTTYEITTQLTGRIPRTTHTAP